MYSQTCIFITSNILQTFALGLYHKLNSASDLLTWVTTRRLYNTVIPRPRHFALIILCPQTQYIKRSVQICMYIQCWRCLWIVELPKSQSRAWPSCWNSEAKHPWRSKGTKLHNRTMMVSKFTERHGLTEASIKVFEATDVNKQQQLDKELHECLLTKRRFCRRRRGLCLARLQCLVSSSHLQGLIYCHLYC